MKWIFIILISWILLSIVSGFILLVCIPFLFGGITANDKSIFFKALSFSMVASIFLIPFHLIGMLRKQLKKFICKIFNK